MTDQMAASIRRAARSIRRAARSICRAARSIRRAARSIRRAARDPPRRPQSAAPPAIRRACKEFQHHTIQTKIEQHFGGIFHQKKVCKPIERQDSMQTVIRTIRRLDSILHEAAQNFEVFSNIQE
jgi:hypothetical protein